MQSSLPAGWLAFTGRELNPLDRYKRFQITLILLFWIYPGARRAYLHLSYSMMLTHLLDTITLSLSQIRT